AALRRPHQGLHPPARGEHLELRDRAGAQYPPGGGRVGGGRRQGGRRRRRGRGEGVRGAGGRRAARPGGAARLVRAADAALRGASLRGGGDRRAGQDPHRQGTEGGATRGRCHRSHLGPRVGRLRGPEVTSARTSPSGRPSSPAPPSIAGAILGQARPIFVGQVAVMLYAVVDTVLTGHASATDLAAMGLGTGVYSTVFVSLLGVTNALNPIIGQHHGGGRHAAIGVSYVQGLWLALLLSLAGGLFLAFPEPWLAWIHAPTDVEALVTRYLRVLAVALPASLMFRVISALNIAV